MFSPLDQFKIVPLFSFSFFGFDFSVTNFMIVGLLNLIVINGLVYASTEKSTNSLFVIPSGWQLIIEKIYSFIGGLISDIITTGSERYFPLMTFIFMFILTNNLIGLVPYSFTITSHMTVTFLISFSIFIGVNIIGFEKHGLNLFSLFLPSNTSIFLALFLIPIELFSYITKPISLGIRLFVNLMAGHSLLKMIAWFSWNILLIENVKAVAFILPILILVLIMGLELVVAFLQAYVFITLTAIYLNDVEALH